MPADMLSGYTHAGTHSFVKWDNYRHTICTRHAKHRRATPYLVNLSESNQLDTRKAFLYKQGIDAASSQSIITLSIPF